MSDPNQQQPLMGQPVQQQYQQQPQQVPQAQVSYGSQQQQYQQPPPYQQQIYQQQPQQYPTMQNPDVPQAEVQITKVEGQHEGFQEDTHAMGFHEHFQKHADRNGFIKKVYALVTVQMIITAAIIAICLSSHDTTKWVYLNGWYIGLPAIFVAIFCQIAIYCCKSVRRMVPHNYILLFIFTLCFGFFAAQECIYWTATLKLVPNTGGGYHYVYSWEDKSTIYKAAIATAGVTGAVTLYAFTTKQNFKVLVGMGFVLVMALLWFLILSLCFGYWLTSFYCSIMVCFYGLFLLCDTEMIIKSGRHGLSIDDYVAGAMLIYSDIIMIFIYMIMHFGGRE